METQGLTSMTDEAQLRWMALEDTTRQPAVILLHGGPGLPDYPGEVAPMVADHGHGDQAAVPGGQFGAIPHVLEQDVVGQLGELRSEVAERAASAADLLGLVGHLYEPQRGLDLARATSSRAVASLTGSPACCRFTDRRALDKGRLPHHVAHTATLGIDLDIVQRMPRTKDSH
jgi:hypothetical protein